MIAPNLCNVTQCIGVLDYAYLSANVYHDKSEDKLLGSRPSLIRSLNQLQDYIYSNQKGWVQIAYSPVNIPFSNEFYADLYVKIYNKKIQHVMVAFRGTMSGRAGNLGEDGITWGDNVALSNDFITPVPTFWKYANIFILNVAKILRAYDQADMLAPIVSYHVTGHSLGGAIANLVAAKAVILTLPGMKSRIPHVPEVISFNAPGIGSMPISSSSFHEHRVITMRAEYDVVSCIGKPYGYIINNVLPEGYETGRKAFHIDHALKAINKWNPISALRSQVDAIAAPAIAFEGRHSLEQHSMANFLKVVAAESSSISLNFLRLRHWADQHGGLNHDFKAKPFWGQAAQSKAA